MRAAAGNKGSVFTGQIGGFPAEVYDDYLNGIYQRDLSTNINSPSPSLPRTSRWGSLGGDAYYVRITETPFTGNKTIYVEITCPGRATKSGSFSLTSSTTYVNIVGTNNAYQAGDVLTVTYKLNNSSGATVFTGYANVYDGITQENYFIYTQGAYPIYNQANDLYVYFFNEDGITGIYQDEGFVILPVSEEECPSGEGVFGRLYNNEFSGGVNVDPRYSIVSTTFIECV